MSNQKKKLLKLIRAHEVIYNTNLVEYKDAGTRNAAWEEISEEMDMPAPDCKVEWFKLRNCYVNALRRRIYHQNRTGKTLPPWIYEPEINFLKPFCGRADDVPYTVLLPDTYEIDEHDDIEVKAEDILTPPQSDRRRKNTKTRKRKLEYNSTDSEELTKEDLFKNEVPYKINSDTISGMDGTDLFFLSISQTVKKLPQLEQCKLKMQIFKLVNDAEIKHIENENSTSYFVDPIQ